MAIAKGNPIITSCHGRLGSIDRTIGRDGGFALNLINARKHTILGVKNLMPHAASPARKERTVNYCSCDKKYKTLSVECKNKLQTHQYKFGTREDKKLTRFMYFMKLCLTSQLCNFRKWTEGTCGTPEDCPHIPVIGTTYINRDLPDRNYSGSWEAWVDTQNSNQPDYPNEKKIVLIELANTATTLDLFMWENWAETDWIKANVHKVAPFDMNTVTWNNQPARLELVGTIETATNGWSKAALTNPGKYISIDQKRITVDGNEFLRIQYFTEEEDESYRPYTI